jgi:GTP-binding protein EngB required for normal cell division
LSDLASVHEFLAWYDQYARPVLAEHAADRLEQLDRERAALAQSASQAMPEFPVCFLGNSGVGKSTLINALAGGTDTIVPSGGIGPLTAQALTVRFDSTRRLVAEYHPLLNLWRHITALQWGYAAELKAKGGSAVPTSIPDVFPIGEDEETDLREESVAESSPNQQQELRKSACLMVTGSQEGQLDVPYLIDSLLEATGKQRRHGTEAREADRVRIDGLKAALARAKNSERFVLESANTPEFAAALRDHASGYLAPLIRELTVHWDTELLMDGLCLVDLPGVGIAGDIYRKITRSWIRERAQGVVLVVDHRGVTEEVAKLLRESEYLNRLLYSADDPTQDPVLIVAVTKIDDIAESRYGADRTRKKREYFADACNECIEKIRSQIREQLTAVWGAERGRLDEAQAQVVENVLSSLQVFPVSSVQFRKLLARDEDDVPFLTDPTQSNVPNMAAALTRLASDRITRRNERTANAAAGMYSRVLALLKVIDAQWRGDSRAQEETQKLRGELDVFLQPLRNEFLIRQGQYSAFLKKTVPQRIKDLVDQSSLQSRQEIQSYLRQLGDAHWATLRASVRRGGRYSGASDIDLPREFALRFEEPIAAAWTKKILKDVRVETRDYASDCAALVERVVDWARGQGARVKDDLLEALVDTVRADAKQLEAVGREMVDELRDEARVQLIEAIAEPIREGCRGFVERNSDLGRGVKDRILRLYAELAEEVGKVASQPASKILTKLFRDVEKEIIATMEAHKDPIAEAAARIVSSQEDYLRRSDGQRRKAVLRAIEAALEAAPNEVRARVSA